MAYYMPFQPVLDAFGGSSKTVNTGASTANQHAPHFADDVRAVPEWIISGRFQYFKYRKPSFEVI